MTLITPDLIEKAAEALFLNSGWRDWKKENPTSQDLWRSRAKVALQAVIPEVVERCAKAVESLDATVPHDVTSGEYAAAIRRLIPQEGK